MIKAFCNFVKITATVIVVTVLLSAVAIKTISQLSTENYALRRQAEDAAQQSQTMACDLHIALLPFLGIDYLTYDFPMEIPATGAYAGSYQSGDTLPILQFEECFFLSLYVTAQ